MTMISPAGVFTPDDLLAADIAIEVVSPDDKVYELDTKLNDYRTASVKLVWVVNPDARDCWLVEFELRENRLLCACTPFAAS